MSDRPRKSLVQDGVGVLFCLLGGFFAVSIGLHLAGQEPVVGFATRPVLELVTLLGPVAALLLSLGAAGVGAWIFLAAFAPAVGRPLAALALGAAGLACLLGAFAHGGSLGDVFPGLVAGTPGRLIGAVLGLVVLFLTVTLLAPRRSGASTADVMRAGIGLRGDLASGVSAAEAALLVTDTRLAARPAPRREEPAREPAPRPIPPEARARPIAAAAASPVLPVKDHAELPPPAVPSWEADELEPQPADAEPEPDEDEERALAAELAAALAEEEGDEPDELVPEEPATQAPAASTPPPASWEQVGLFDEDEEEAEEEAQPTVAPALATPSFAFEEAPAPRHEPERATADDPFAAEPVTPPAPVASVELAEAEEEPEELDEPDEPELAADEPAVAPEEESRVAELAPMPPPAPAAPPEFELQPRPAARQEPVVVRDGERERWERLVFDSGLLILEQKRVAVSMLERRFGIDFDSACKVLDELQQAGLIGPYIGGRTREILLAREQWLAQAPQTA